METTRLTLLLSIGDGLFISKPERLPSGAAFHCPGNQLHIETHRITAINFDTGGVPFQDYALSAVFDPTANIVAQRIEATFGVPYAQAAAVAPIVTQGIVANYAGDENPLAQTQALIGQFITDPETRRCIRWACCCSDCGPIFRPARQMGSWTAS